MPIEQPGDLAPATAAQKAEYLKLASRGFTRGLYHDLPIEDLPLFTNGYDFYLLTFRTGGSKDVRLEEKGS